MDVSEWFGGHWFDLIQTAGIVGSLLFAAYTSHKDEKARKIYNLISINENYHQIWREFYDRPALARVLKRDVDLNKKPISEEEWLFVKMLILHLDTVRRAINLGMFVKIEELRQDAQEFFALPIPKAVWDGVKKYQNADFVEFIESTLSGNRQV